MPVGAKSCVHRYLEIDPLEEKMALRTFWRIVMDFNYTQKADGTTETILKLFAEMTLWEINAPVRLGRLVENLPYVIEPAGAVTCEDGMAKFTGGYIRGEFHRERMEQQLLDALSGSDLESIKFGDISNPFGDENISIMARVRLPEDPAHEERPIFYMNQPTTRGREVEEGAPGLDAVSLVETVKNGDERKIVWEISGDQHEASRIFRISDVPDNEHPRGFHRIRVNQDTGISSSPYVYEILVDSIPLDGPLPAVPASHRFHSGPVEFYIGGEPDGRGGVTGLHGQISYLEFDPNNSCNNCWG